MLRGYRISVAIPIFDSKEPGDMELSANTICVSPCQRASVLCCPAPVRTLLAA